MSKPEPITSAEGVVIPTVVPESSAAQIAAAPTPADYHREHNTWKARYPLFVDGVRAVNVGGSVPASHPRLRAGEWGPGWIAEGAVEATGLYDVPEPTAPSGPGGATFPGASPS